LFACALCRDRLTFSPPGEAGWSLCFSVRSGPRASVPDRSSADPLQRSRLRRLRLLLRGHRPSGGGPADLLAAHVDGPFVHGGPGTYVYAPPLAIALMPLSIFDRADCDAGLVPTARRCSVVACALLPVSRWARLAAFAVTAFGCLPERPVARECQRPDLLLLAVAWRWLDRPASAVAVAATIAIRPQMVLLLAWWVLRRRWSIVAWCVSAGLVLMLATLPVVGVDAYLTSSRSCATSD
jgi:hypothetical protein